MVLAIAVALVEGMMVTSTVTCAKDSGDTTDPIVNAINAGVILDIDFANHNLLVTSGSNV